MVKDLADLIHHLLSKAHSLVDQDGEEFRKRDIKAWVAGECEVRGYSNDETQEEYRRQIVKWEMQKKTSQR